MKLFRRVFFGLLLSTVTGSLVFASSCKDEKNQMYRDMKSSDSMYRELAQQNTRDLQKAQATVNRNKLKAIAHIRRHNVVKDYLSADTKVMDTGRGLLKKKKGYAPYMDTMSSVEQYNFTQKLLSTRPMKSVGDYKRTLALIEGIEKRTGQYVDTLWGYYNNTIDKGIQGFKRKKNLSEGDKKYILLFEESHRAQISAIEFRMKMNLYAAARDFIAKNRAGVLLASCEGSSSGYDEDALGNMPSVSN